MPKLILQHNKGIRIYLDIKKYLEQTFQKDINENNYKQISMDIKRLPKKKQIILTFKEGVNNE